MRYISTIAVTLFLTGCAAPWVLGSQTISFTVVDKNTGTQLEGAACEIIDREGKKYRASPGQDANVMIHKGKGPLDIQCKKPGYKQVAIGVGDSFETIDSFQDLLFLPAVVIKNIFLLPQYMFHYPSHIVIKMDRN